MTKFRGAKPKPSAFGKPEASTPAADPERLPPIFSFEHMRERSGYSVDCCESDHKAALASSLFKYSKMTWFDIRQAPRHGLGCEKIRRDAMKCGLPDIVTDDVNLLAIRYKGMNAMVGFKNGRVFYILMIDHNFTAYDHG